MIAVEHRLEQVMQGAVAADHHHARSTRQLAGNRARVRDVGRLEQRDRRRVLRQPRAERLAQRRGATGGGARIQKYYGRRHAALDQPPKTIGIGCCARMRRPRHRRIDATVGAGGDMMEWTVRAPMASTIVEVSAAPGESVRAGQALVVVEAMKMEHELRAGAVARRRATGQRTARENIEALCDTGSFVEYGALAYAAQRSRRALDDLIRNTPADGMVTGIGSVNGALHGAEASRCVVMAYDATVLAGTQGMRNHQKTDRMLGIALDQRLPTVLFAEGGGGRPGDVDMPIVAGLHVTTFASFARLSGKVPVLGIAAGRCFAGNAELLGCCETIVATRGSSIGMGGPAMVEGG